MIPELGHFALLLALALALAQAGTGLLGAGHRNHPMMASAGRLALAQAAALGLAFGALILAYVQSDFSVRNVYENSHSLKPMLYKVTGVWGNHEGSMLLWVSVLALYGAMVAVFGRNLSPTLQARVLGVQGLIGVAFIAFIAFTSNPFLRLDPAPLDGKDLNPLLQDPGLAFHPPLLYSGYVGLSVTYAFAIAGLLEGNIDAAWARWVRPWTLASWLTLTMGIALGSWWAYYELGWGGFWFWDPVENASLMPWLMATALLHSAIVVERRETLKSWTVLLAILAFSMSLLGTFLVRSGVITSVHAFANDPARGIFILGIMVASVGGALALFAWRAPSLASGNVVFAPISREVSLLINNAVLAAVASAVLIGTLLPLIGKELMGVTFSVGPPYFNLVVSLLMGPLMLLVPLGPILPWKRASLGEAARRLTLAAMVAAIGVVLFAAFAYRTPVLAVLGIGLGLWLVAGAIADLAGKARLTTAPWRTAMARLTGLPRGQVGTALAHAGLGIVVMGVIGASVWQEELVTTMKPGEAVEIAGYRVVLERVEKVPGPNYVAERATMRVEAGGDRVAVLYPEKRNYPVTGMPTTEAAIRSNGVSDLYAVIGDPQPGGAHVVRLYFNPLAPWIFAGAMLMAFGAAVSLSDHRFRIAIPGLRRARGRLAGVQ